MTTADDTTSAPAPDTTHLAAQLADTSRTVPTMAAGSNGIPADEAAAAAQTPQVPSLENARRSQEEVEEAFRTATDTMRRGLLDEAAAQLRKILFTHPDHAKARANLGNCQFLQGDLAGAEASFRAVLGDAPENHNALYGLATILVDQGNLEEAQGYAGRLAALLPESAPALALLGDAASADPRPGTAIAAYRAALRFDDTYAPALTGLSRLLLKRGRIDEAYELALHAAELDETSAAAFTCLADALAAQGDLASAREGYETAMRLAPGDTDLMIRMSLLARKAGDLRAALRHADDACTERSEDREAGNAIGAALAALGERLAAREVLTAMANRRPVPDWVRDVIERHRTVPMPDFVWSPHASAAPPTVTVDAEDAADLFEDGEHASTTETEAEDVAGSPSDDARHVSETETVEDSVTAPDASLKSAAPDETPDGAMDEPMDPATDNEQAARPANSDA